MSMLKYLSDAVLVLVLISQLCLIAGVPFVFIVPTFGISMWPSIPPMSIVLAIPAVYYEPTLVKVGDAIVWYSPGSLPPCHRVIQIIKQGSTYKFVTKGDNNPTPDYPPVVWDRVLAVVPEVRIGSIRFYPQIPFGVLIALLMSFAVPEERRRVFVRIVHRTTVLAS